MTNNLQKKWSETLCDEATDEAILEAGKLVPTDVMAKALGQPVEQVLARLKFLENAANKDYVSSLWNRISEKKLALLTSRSSFSFSQNSPSKGSSSSCRVKNEHEKQDQDDADDEDDVHDGPADQTEDENASISECKTISESNSISSTDKTSHAKANPISSPSTDVKTLSNILPSPIQSDSPGNATSNILKTYHTPNNLYNSTQSIVSLNKVESPNNDVVDLTCFHHSNTSLSADDSEKRNFQGMSQEAAESNGHALEKLQRSIQQMSSQQKEVYDQVMNGKNVFFTGMRGSMRI
jgi:hypothetical protein